jgi:hypothetical protein
MVNRMCPDRQILSVYADGELPSPWKEKLEAHVASCPACREALESWRGISASLWKADDPAVKERVWGDLSRRIDGADQAERFQEIVPASGFWRRSVTLPFPAAAALGAAAAAAFVLTLTSLWFRAVPAVAAPAAAPPVISGIDTELISISPLNDMSQVLQYLSSTDSNDIVIIRLPESRSFQSAGEPQIIKAADYSPRRPQ